MMENNPLRMTLVNGYHKKDVEQYLAEMTAKTETIQREKAEEIAVLEEKCATLAEEKKDLEEKLTAEANRKVALVQVEVDAQMRADQCMAKAQAEAAKILEQARKTVQEKETESQNKLDLALEQHQNQLDHYRAKVMDTATEALSLQGNAAALLAQLMATNQRLQQEIQDLQALAQGEAVANPVENEPEMVHTLTEEVSMAELPLVEAGKPQSSHPSVEEMFRQIIAEEA